MKMFQCNSCHGCGGRGWVVAGTGSPVACVICKGTGDALPEYKKAKASQTVNKCPNAGKPCYCTGACRQGDELATLNNLLNATKILPFIRNSFT